MSALLTLVGAFGEPSPRSWEGRRAVVAADPSRVFVVDRDEAGLTVKFVEPGGGERVVLSVPCGEREDCTAFDVDGDGERVALLIRERDKPLGRLVIAPTDGAARVEVGAVVREAYQGLFVGDGDRVLCEGAEGWALRDARDGRLLRVLGECERVTVSPSGDLYACIGSAGRASSDVRVSRGAGHDFILRVEEIVGPAAFSRDEAVLWMLTLDDGTSKFTLLGWEFATGDLRPVALDGISGLVEDGTGDRCVTVIGSPALRAVWTPGGVELQPHAGGSPTGPDACAPRPAAGKARERRWEVEVRNGAPFVVERGSEARRPVLDPHEGAACALRLSRDERTIAVGHRHGAIRLLDVDTGAVRQAFEGHEAAVTACLWAPDGRTLCSISRDGALRTWEVATGLESSLAYAFHPPFRDMQPAMSPDGAVVALESMHGYALWDLARASVTDRPVGLPGRLDAPWILGYRGADLAMVNVCTPLLEAPGTVIVLVGPTGRPLREESLPRALWERDEVAAPAGMTRSEDGRYLLHRSGAGRPGEWLWDCVEGRAVWADGPSVAFDRGDERDETTAVALGARWIVEGNVTRPGGAGSTRPPSSAWLSLWNAQRCEELARAELPAGETAAALALSADERWLYVGTDRGRVLRYRVDDRDTRPGRAPYAPRTAPPHATASTAPAPTIAARPAGSDVTRSGRPPCAPRAPAMGAATTAAGPATATVRAPGPRRTRPGTTPPPPRGRRYALGRPP